MSLAEDRSAPAPASVGKIPVGDRREGRVVTSSHTPSLVGRKPNTGVRHTEWFGDADSDQTLIVRSGAVCEEVAEQPGAQV